MIAIGYGDGSSRVMTYSGTEYGGSQFIRSVTLRDGSTTWYEYGTTYDKPDGQAYYTEVINTRPNGQSRTSRYEYWIAYLSDGTAYTSRTRTTERGQTTDTRYDPNGTPIHIQRGAADAQFEYDERGRLTLKTDGDMVIRLSYDDRVNKISKVVQHPIGQPDQQLISLYAYDANGNLTSASNSDGQRFQLSYNALAQIARAESPDTVMSFTYNAMGKPVTIVVDGLGTLNVSYDADGEIEKVDAGEGGHRMALRITQAFQSLLSLVKPAGVSLNL
jgi:YD repeat-containing protein